MTNFEKIKAMTPEQFTQDILNACDNHSCSDCPLKNGLESYCYLNNNNNSDTIAWLESEVKE